MRRLALLAVATVVILAGCGMLGSDPDPTREQRAVDTLDNATDALAEVETHRSNSEITVTAGNRRVTGETSSVVDFEERRARTTGTIQGTETASYLVNNTAYVDCQQPWGWGTEEFDSYDEPVTIEVPDEATRDPREHGCPGA